MPSASKGYQAIIKKNEYRAMIVFHPLKTYIGFYANTFSAALHVARAMVIEYDQTQRFAGLTPRTMRIWRLIPGDPQTREGEHWRKVYEVSVSAWLQRRRRRQLSVVARCLKSTLLAGVFGPALLLCVAHGIWCPVVANEDTLTAWSPFRSRWADGSSSPAAAQSVLQNGRSTGRYVPPQHRPPVWRDLPDDVYLALTDPTLTWVDVPREHLPALARVLGSDVQRAILGHEAWERIHVVWFGRDRVVRMYRLEQEDIMSWLGLDNRAMRSMLLQRQSVLSALQQIFPLITMPAVR